MFSNIQDIPKYFITFKIQFTNLSHGLQAPDGMSARCYLAFCLSSRPPNCPFPASLAFQHSTKYPKLTATFPEKFPTLIAGWLTRSFSTLKPVWALMFWPWPLVPKKFFTRALSTPSKIRQHCVQFHISSLLTNFSNPNASTTKILLQ